MKFNCERVQKQDMNLLRTFALITVLTLNFILSSCVTFRTPAPKVPVNPMMEPPLESSTITVPISISLASLSDTLNHIFSGNKTLSKLDKKNNVTGKAQDLLSGQKALSDADLLNNFYLRYAVKKAWEALQDPIRLNYNLSLLLNLQSVHISQPARLGDTSKIIVGLVAKPRLVSGDIAQASTLPLPIFSVMPGLQDTGLHIALDNELSFDFIGNELTRKFMGTTYSIDKKIIIIDRVKIYGSGNLVVMEVTISGTAKGKIYFTGVPAYDESTKTLYINNLDYTIETKHVLVKAANWLLHTNLQENLINEARWDFTDKIDSLKDRLSDVLNHKVNRYLSISGKIQSIHLIAVGLTQTSIKAVLIADGKAEVSVF